MELHIVEENDMKKKGELPLNVLPHCRQHDDPACDIDGTPQPMTLG